MSDTGKVVAQFALQILACSLLAIGCGETIYNDRGTRLEGPQTKTNSGKSDQRQFSASLEGSDSTGYYMALSELPEVPTTLALTDESSDASPRCVVHFCAERYASDSIPSLKDTCRTAAEALDTLFSSIFSFVRIQVKLDNVSTIEQLTRAVKQAIESKECGPDRILAYSGHILSNKDAAQIPLPAKPTSAIDIGAIAGQLGVDSPVTTFTNCSKEPCEFGSSGSSSSNSLAKHPRFNDFLQDLKQCIGEGQKCKVAEVAARRRDLDAQKSADGRGHDTHSKVDSGTSNSSRTENTGSNNQTNQTTNKTGSQQSGNSQSGSNTNNAGQSNIQHNGMTPGLGSMPQTSIGGMGQTTTTLTSPGQNGAAGAANTIGSSSNSSMPTVAVPNTTMPPLHGMPGQNGGNFGSDYNSVGDYPTSTTEPSEYEYYEPGQESEDGSDGPSAPSGWPD